MNDVEAGAQHYRHSLRPEKPEVSESESESGLFGIASVMMCTFNMFFFLPGATVLWGRCAHQHM